MSLKIKGETIPQKFQRYSTVGDWTGHKKRRLILISEMDYPDYEQLIFLHEFIEQALCLQRGISDEEVTKFDIEYEKSGKKGEPGDDPAAPYHKEHVYATAIEQSLCKELGYSWSAYERFLNEYVRENMP